MRRTSNLAFNRTCGLRSLEDGQGVSIVHEKSNAFDRNAVAVCIKGRDIPVGWLFKKDNNRAPALEKLKRGGVITGRIERDGEKYIVVFWL